MRTISEQYFKDNLSHVLNQINDKTMPLIISRNHNRSIVIMSKFAYDAIEELFEIIGKDVEKLYNLYSESGNSSKDF